MPTLPPSSLRVIPYAVASDTVQPATRRLDRPPDLPPPSSKRLFAERDGDYETHTICGTPNYMAPEVQDSGYGLSADLWSAGCLFYSMVTGGAPFQGGRVGETLANAKAGRYVEPGGLSPAAKDFMARMLELVGGALRRRARVVGRGGGDGRTGMDDVGLSDICIY